VCGDGRKEDGGFVSGGNIVKQLQPCNKGVTDHLNVDDHLSSLTNCLIVVVIIVVVVIVLLRGLKLRSPFLSACCGTAGGLLGTGRLVPQKEKIILYNISYSNRMMTQVNT